MSATAKVLQDLALLIARLGLGGVLLLHAVRRWQTSGMPAQIAYVQAYGVPYADVVAWAGLIGEALAGLGLVLGVATRLAAAGVVAEQVLIVCWITWRRNPLTTDNSAEHQVVVGVLALLFVAFGAGRVAIDALFRRSKTRRTDPDDSDLP